MGKGEGVSSGISEPGLSAGQRDKTSGFGVMVLGLKALGFVRFRRLRTQKGTTLEDSGRACGCSLKNGGS